MHKTLYVFTLVVLILVSLSSLLQDGGVGGSSGPRTSSLRYSRANGSTHASLGSRPSTGDSTTTSQQQMPKKSNWEVIEHYHKSGLVGTSNTSRTPTEEEAPPEEVESILESTKMWWDVCTLCRRVFRSHQFKNIHIEVLYQRYFLRMNQSSMVSLLGLLLLVVLVMLGVMYTLGFTNFLSQALTLLSFAMLYLILELLLWRSRLLNEVYLIIFSYLVLLSFFGLEILVTLSSDPPTASAGVWAALFFIYMTYTLLPLRVIEATVGGILLSVAHIVCTFALAREQDEPFLWKQVSCVYFDGVCREVLCLACWGRRDMWMNS